MKADWDETKNKENIRKHGFDFADAAEIFDFPMLAQMDFRRDYGEFRVVAIGFLSQRVAVVVFVEGDDDTIRIISLRKASRHERKRFEEFLRIELGTN